MASELPIDQIRDLKILLRKEANLSWYQPEKDTSLQPISKLPSVLDTIAELDPCLPDLRCKNCKRRLLRGAESLFCVFCGLHPSKELPPEPIKFKKTFGYRWLLDSLHLEESDVATPGLSNMKKSAANDGIPLSELLDVKIRWSSESDSLADGISNGNLVWGKGAFSGGAGLDNFFSPRESANESSQDQLAQNKRDDNATSDTSPNALGTTEKHPSLFENLYSSGTAKTDTEGEIDSSFSDWEANFQSTNSRTLPEKSISGHPFVGSSVDLTAHMDLVFRFGVDAKAKNDLNSTADDWFCSGVPSNSNAAISGQTGKPETSHYLNEGDRQECVDYSSKNFTWTQDDPWKNITNKSAENMNPGEGDNLFDAWNDFTSSTSAFGSFHSTGRETANQTSLSIEPNAHIDLLSYPNKSNDSEAFSQSDFVSAPVNSSSTSTKLESTQSNYLLDRVSEMHPIIDYETCEDLGGSKSESKVDKNVEMLMSQMHDLSIMNKSNLSVPPK